MLTRQFLTVKDVADLLKIGEVTVRHWVKDGELRAIDVGREWRIAPGDLEHFLQSRSTTTQTLEKSPRGVDVKLPEQDPRAAPGSAGKASAGKNRTD